MLCINTTFWKSLAVALIVGVGIAWAGSAQACAVDHGIIDIRLGVSAGSDQSNDAELAKLEERVAAVVRCNAKLEKVERTEGEPFIVLRYSKGNGEVVGLVAVVESAVSRATRRSDPDLVPLVFAPSDENYVLARQALAEVMDSPHQGAEIPMTPALGILVSRVIPVATIMAIRWPEGQVLRAQARAK